MNKVARFEKVSYEQFEKDMLDCFPYMNLTKEKVENAYNNIKLPKRSTKGSAGYDFFLPFDIGFKPNEYVRLPTGIRCEMEEGWVLMLYPRSGLGFKYIERFANSTGVIDSDYAYADNEGHIHCKVKFGTYVRLEAGKAFMQGVFVPFGITVDDDADGVRVGGFGSTDRKDGDEL